MTSGYARPPSPALRPWVEKLWYVADDNISGWELRLPGLGSQLLLNLDTDRLGEWDPRSGRLCEVGGAAVATITARSSLLYRGQQRRLAAAVLRPGATAALLGVPAHALADTTVVDLADLWRAGAERLRERCQAASTAQEVLAVLDAELCDRIAPEVTRPVAISRVIDGLRAGRAVGDVAAECGMSLSTLRRGCHDALGVSPKSAQRLLRLDAAVRGLEDAVTIAELAARLGFHDQAHFTHDFSELTGMTPRRFRLVAEGGGRHVAMDDGFLQAPTTTGS